MELRPFKASAYITTREDIGHAIEAAQEAGDLDHLISVLREVVKSPAWADQVGGDQALRHEVLDRAVLIAGLVNSHLIEHPIVMASPELTGAAQTALEGLTGLAQAVCSDE